MKNSSNPSQSWHTQSATACCEYYKTPTETGITTDEAASRLQNQGPNALPKPKRRPLWRQFLDQFNDFMVIVLLVAALISGLIGELFDTIAIVTIVILNAVIGFVQEYRAERALEALQHMISPVARVMREGKTLALSAE
ncbi:MAG: ATPase, partial [Candidatus Thiodiazotropha sp. (ex Ctena orbiculata)]|nr:ATPase [Candidatus Thiodiazotropha taylori]